MEKSIKNQFRFVFWCFLLLAVLDGYTTIYALQNFDHLYEANPFVRMIPLSWMIPAQIIGTLLAFSVLYYALTRLYKKNSWLKPIYLIFVLWFCTGIKYMVVLNNYLHIKGVL
jgi:hypothetical protein